jgi:hypothetical protein
MASVDLVDLGLKALAGLVQKVEPQKAKDGDNSGASDGIELEERRTNALKDAIGKSPFQQFQSRGISGLGHDGLHPGYDNTKLAVVRVLGDGRRQRTRAFSELTELLARIRRLVDARPSYGYRRINALLNRQAEAEGLARLNTRASTG